MPYHISLSSSPSFTLLLILANPDNGLIQLMKVDLLDGLYKIDLAWRWMKIGVPMQLFLVIWIYCIGPDRSHLHILQWARSNGCPWDEDTCSYAARGGYLNTLQWAARVNACPWNKETCTYAAAGGHLHILQWARTNGCPWDEETLSSLGPCLG